VAAARQGTLGELGKGQKPLSDLELELAKLKRELAEVKMGRDLLKKCTAYFVRTSA
jgi:transposase